LAQIAAYPQHNPVYTENTRRHALPRFPYAVVFQEKEDILLVIAVAHAKRRPVYWKQRV